MDATFDEIFCELSVGFNSGSLFSFTRRMEAGSPTWRREDACGTNASPAKREASIDSTNADDFVGKQVMPLATGSPKEGLEAAFFTKGSAVPSDLGGSFCSAFACPSAVSVVATPSWHLVSDEGGGGGSRMTGGDGRTAAGGNTGFAPDGGEGSGQPVARSSLIGGDASSTEG